MAKRKNDDGQEQVEGMENEGAPVADVIEGAIDEGTANAIQGGREPRIATADEISSFIGGFVDPSEDIAVRIHEESHTIVVNSTQVSREHINGLLRQIPGSGWTVTVTDSHPSEVQL